MGEISNGIIEFYFNNNTYFLTEESIFYYFLQNILLSPKFINSNDYSIFTTTTSFLIENFGIKEEMPFSSLLQESLYLSNYLSIFTSFLCY